MGLFGSLGAVLMPQAKKMDYIFWAVPLRLHEFAVVSSLGLRLLRAPQGRGVWAYGSACKANRRELPQLSACVSLFLLPSAATPVWQAFRVRWGDEDRNPK